MRMNSAVQHLVLKSEFMKKKEKKKMRKMRVVAY